MRIFTRGKKMSYIFLSILAHTHTCFIEMKCLLQEAKCEYIHLWMETLCGACEWIRNAYNGAGITIFYISRIQPFILFLNGQSIFVGVLRDGLLWSIISLFISFHCNLDYEWICSVLLNYLMKRTECWINLRSKRKRNSSTSKYDENKHTSQSIKKNLTLYL